MEKLASAWSNLPFAQKISILPVLAGLSFAILLGVSWSSGSKNENLLRTVEEGYYASLDMRHALKANLEETHRALQDAVTTGDTELLKTAQNLKARMDERMTAATDIVTLDQQERAAFVDTLDAYFSNARGGSEALMRDDYSEEQLAKLKTANELYESMMSGLEEAIVADGQAVSDGFRTVMNSQSRATMTFLGVIAIFAVLLVAVSYFIISRTRSSLDEVGRRLSALAAGDLSRMEQQTAEDEIGQMMNQVARVNQNVQSLMSQVSRLIEHVREGALDARGDAGEFEGAYRQLVHDMNELIAQFVRPIAMTSDYVEQIARGDIPAVIEEEFAGDFDRIKRNLNDLIRTMDELVSQTGRLTEAAKSGQLDQRGQAERLEGAWRELIGGINDTLDCVAGPIDQVSRFMSSMASGNLTWRISDDYRGQFAKLGADANAAGEKLNSVISSIHTVAGTIQTGTDELASGNSDLERRTEQQAASLEQARASISVVTNAVRDNAKNSMEAKGVAESTRRLAQDGENVVRRASDAMSALIESSQSVAAIVDLIDDIAFQTNLLALNAAIEAARAGQEGQGFAAVASEVRSLAERSADSAKQIKSLISDSNERVREGDELVQNSGKTLEEIIVSVKRVADLVVHISNASQEQTRGINEVNEIIIELDEMTTQNSELVTEIAANSKSIDGQTKGLTDMLNFFATNDSDARPAAPRRQLKAAG